MPRPKLTKEAQLRGIRKAIRSIERKRLSPKWLLPGMRRFARRLEAEIGEGSRNTG
jgi:hypothetical protein